MPHLAQELGRSYMDQFYKDAFFVFNDKIHLYKGHIDSANIITSSTPLRAEERWSGDSIPSASITNMAAFRWPKLGYRQFKLDNQSDLLVYYVSSTRSAMRGLKKQFLRYDPAPSTALMPMLGDPANFVGTHNLMRAIFAPTFCTYREGLDLLRNNKTGAFALNEDFAVGIPVGSTRNHLYDIMYKGETVGYVDNNGIAVLPGRLRKRPSVYHLFQGQINL